MGGWLAGLDAFVVGLAYLGALLATRFVVRPLLLTMFGSAPVIGGWLTGRVDQALGDFERNITPAAEASMGTIVSALDWLTTQGRAVLSGIGDLADATYSLGYKVSQLSIPQAVGVAAQWVENLVESAKAWALLQVQAVEARLGGELAYAQAQESAALQIARGEALDAVSAAERVVLDEIRKAEQATGQLFQQAEYDAGQAVAASEIKLADLVSRAREDLSNGIAGVEHDLQQLGQAVGVAVENVGETLGGDIGAAEARLQAAIAASESGLGATIDQVIKSGPWAGVVAMYTGGEAALKADVETIVRLSLKELRQQVAEVGVLRAKYGPQIKAAVAEIERVV